MSLKKKIFIASSSKSVANGYVAKLEKVLETYKDEYDVIVWSSSKAFVPNEQIWSELKRNAEECHKAFFIFAEDDSLNKDGTLEPQWFTRDNVVLEYGLFAKTNKQNNAIIIRVGNVTIPSDIRSVIYITPEGDKYNDEPFLNEAFQTKIADFLDINTIDDKELNNHTYYFVKIDVVDSSYALKESVNVLELFEIQLKYFWDEFSKQEFFKNAERIEYDDIIIFGTSEVRQIKQIVDYFDQFLRVDLKKHNAEFKQQVLNQLSTYSSEIDHLKDIKFRVSIVQEHEAQINNKTTFTHFRGKAIKVSKKFKFFGNYNSLSIDEGTYHKLSQTSMSQFVNLDLSIDYNSFYGLYALLNEQARTIAKNHFAQGEWVFAAMMLLQYEIPSVLTNTKEILTIKDNLVEPLLRELDFLKKQPSIFPIYVVSELLACKFGYKSEPLCIEFTKYISKAIKYFMGSEKEDPFYLYYLLKIGISPKNYFIGRQIDEILENKKLKATKNSMYHDNCGLCTSKVFFTLNFLQSESYIYISDNYSKKLNKLKKEIIAFFEQSHIKRVCYCTQGGVERDLRYAANMLMALTIGNQDQEFKTKTTAHIINHFIERKDWLKYSEHGKVRLRSLVLSSISAAYKFKLLETLDPSVITNLKTRVLEELLLFEKDLVSLRELESVLGLDGIEGLINVLDSGLFKYCNKENISGDTANTVKKFELLIEQYHKMFNDFDLFDEKNTGLWGFERQRTFYRISYWFKHWEYKLKKMQTTS